MAHVPVRLYTPWRGKDVHKVMSDVTGLVRVADHREGAISVCEIAGELDASNVDSVLEHVVDTVGSDASGLALDLTKTSYLDSAGVRILFELARRLRARHQELRIAVPNSGIVRRVLVLTALADVVPVDDDINRSVRALGG
jgi:anti-anti-sigma factor